MQNELLKKYLEQKDCTKFVCGAGNEDYDSIKNLIALYSSAGCKFFDINASIEAIQSAKKGILYSGQDDCVICISVGVDDDVHLSKYRINENLCVNCEKCISLCPQGAILQDNNVTKIDEKKCIGCGICCNNCENNAIERYKKENSWQDNFDELKNHVDCVEFHIMSKNKDEIISKWDFLCKNFDGFLSISTTRTAFEENELKELLSYMVSKKDKKLLIIQADGVPMSGNKDDYRTTLQAVATADFIKKLNLGTYICVSGGTNSKTKSLLDKCELEVNSIAIGSWARKVVREYTCQSDFLTNKKVFNKALEIAKKVIASTKS